MQRRRPPRRTLEENARRRQHGKAESEAILQDLDRRIDDSTRPPPETPPSIDEYRRQLGDDLRRHAEAHAQQLLDHGDAGKPSRRPDTPRSGPTADLPGQGLLPGFQGQTRATRRRP
jgi:hypothetical protein